MISKELEEILKSPITKAAKGRFISIEQLEQIKTVLEAWEVVKKHCNYQDGDRFNCIPEGFYIIEPIKGKDYLIVRKALEAENEKED